MAVFFALMTFVGWGVGDVFVTIVARRYGNLNALFWGQVTSIILASLFIPFAGEITSFWMFIYALLLGLVLAWGTLFYFRALEVGNAQLAGTISGSYALLTVFLSVLFFGEKISVPQIFGMVLIFLGLILACLEMKKIRKQKMGEIFSDKSITYALLAMIIWGIYYAVVRIPVESLGWFWTFYPANLFFIILIFLGKVTRNAFNVFSDRKALAAIVIFSILLLAAQFSFNLAILRGYTSIVAPIAGSYPVLFVFLARIVFREKLNFQQKVGIISSLMGIVILSLAS